MKVRASTREFGRSPFIHSTQMGGPVEKRTENGRRRNINPRLRLLKKSSADPDSREGQTQTF